MDDQILNLIEKSKYHRIFARFLFVFTVLLLILFINSRLEVRHLMKMNRTSVERLKHEKDSIIHLRFKENAKLLRLNELMHKEVEKSKHRFDSLQRKRQKVKIIYIDQLKKIDDFDSKKLEKYWQNEL